MSLCEGLNDRSLRGSEFADRRLRRVIDATPDAKEGQGEVTVKIASISEPQLPPELSGLPFRRLSSRGSP